MDVEASNDQFKDRTQLENEIKTLTEYILSN